MLLSERHQRIIDLVRDNQTLSTKKISDILYVSSSTIRRDLAYLSNQGLIKRFHGGATSIYTTQIEYSNILRVQTQVSEKKRIASKCAELLEDGRTYFFDSSTTVSHLIPYLKRYTDMTIITNGIDTAKQLSSFTQFKLFLACGVISFSTTSVVGTNTNAYLKKFNSNFFIFSCNGLSLNGGVTEANHEQMETKATMLSNSAVHILLVDHTKFDKTSSYRTCFLEDIDILITDRMPSKKYVETLNQLNVKLIVSDYI